MGKGVRIPDRDHRDGFPGHLVGNRIHVSLLAQRTVRDEAEKYTVNKKYLFYTYTNVLEF